MTIANAVSISGWMLSTELDWLSAQAKRRRNIVEIGKVPENLLRFWVGHSGRSVTDLYDRVREDRDSRFIAEQVGLGFDPPEVRKPVVSPRSPHSHPEKLFVSV
jgi:hypothetical protein